MEQVLAQIEAGNLHEALVRLWVVAGRRTADDLVLNFWERESEPARFLRYSRQFHVLLTAGSAVGPVHAAEEPLALIEALDVFLAQERAPRRQRSAPCDIDGQEFWLVRTPLRRMQAPAARQANNRASWFRHHHVIPALVGAFGESISVHVRAPDRATHRRLAALRERKSARVYLAHFVDGVTLNRVSSAAKKFFVSGLSDAVRRTQSITEHLIAAADARADFVIFPELTVTSEQREDIRRWYRKAIDAGGPTPIFIVAGSFHEVVAGRHVNRAQMLGAHGEVLTHIKVRPYGLAGAEAEDISSGDRIELLATPIGIISMPICKDFNDVAGIDWTPMGPDWCLVPSMGDETNVKAHTGQAERLWKVLFRTVSLVGNQEYDGGPIPGFAYDGSIQPAAAGGGVVSISMQSIHLLT